MNIFKLDKNDRGEVISFPLIGSFEVTYMNKVMNDQKLELNFIENFFQINDWLVAERQ